MSTGSPALANRRWAGRPGCVTAGSADDVLENYEQRRGADDRANL